MNNNHILSIIISAYNEEESIGQVLDDLKSTLNKPEFEYEVIVVDDGSIDKTAEIAKNKEGIRLIRHPYNKGYGAALKTGIRNAKADIVLFMDADIQHKSQDIFKLLEYIDEYDMVVGARSKSSKFQLYRKVAKLLLTAVANYLSGTEIPDLNSGFRSIKRNIALEFMPILPNTFSFTTTITLACIKSGYNIKYVPIESSERVGTSKINPLKDGFNFFLLILRTIVLFDPLKVFLPISGILFAFGLFYGLYQVIFYLNIPDSSILFLVSSFIIFFFGILADQISSLRREIK